MGSLMGITLDSGKRVKKNQKILKEINLYLVNRRLAAKRMTIKRKRLAKTGNCNKL